MSNVLMQIENSTTVIDKQCQFGMGMLVRYGGRLAKNHINIHFPSISVGTHDKPSTAFEIYTYNNMFMVNILIH